MSNTTFDAKQAVKYMLDGFDCIDNTGRVFSINAYYLYVDKEYIDGQFARFLNDCEKLQFKLQHKNLVEWYRPIIVWQENSQTQSPTYWLEDKNFYRTKDDFLNSYDPTELYKIKVVEWETKLFPATWEECDV